jgi:hypothetical protein
MISKAPRDGRQIVVVSGAQPGHGSLDEVAETVQLVAPLKIAVPRALRFAPEARVKIAVRFLRGTMDPATWARANDPQDGNSLGSNW